MVSRPGLFCLARVFSRLQLAITSPARAKGAIGRLNFNFTLVLSARGEPKSAARGLNSNGARPFVWIIHKLV
jgi:hypothetical protein